MMSTAAESTIRLAHASDAAAVATIHADSWRRYYRGAYSDRYLDGNLVADRFAVWSDRLAQPDSRRFTLVAEHRAQLIGFAHVDLDADPAWGSLVDNLHVIHSRQRSGVGSRLLDAAARLVIERRPRSGMYLWVQEQNKQAQAFYLSRRGILSGHELVHPPQGDPRNLNGRPAKIRVAWPDPRVLLLPD